MKSILYLEFSHTLVLKLNRAISILARNLPYAWSETLIIDTYLRPGSARSFSRVAPTPHQQLGGCATCTHVTREGRLEQGRRHVDLAIQPVVVLRLRAVPDVRHLIFSDICLLQID